MSTIKTNSDIEKEEDDIDGLLNPLGDEFVFYKITRPKSCNKQTQLLAGRFSYIGQNE